MPKLDIEEYSWVIRGKQRRDIIRHIDEHETPSRIAEKSKYSLNHTSRVLGDFRKHGIVKCLNPEKKTGRLYILTGKGKTIKDKLNENP